jgi:putative ABC transport system permease protein
MEVNNLGFSLGLKMAINSILSNKLRTLLTMLGVIIGVASVIAAVGFAKGATSSITDSIESIGTNLISISLRGKTTSNVTYNDITEKLDVLESISNYAPVVMGSVSIKNDNNDSITTNYIGTNNNYLDVQDRSIQDGRFLTSFDISGSLKVAVIGTYIANELFPEENAINQYIKFNGQSFKVVGILTQVSGGEQSTKDDQIIIPYTIAQRLNRGGSINTIYVRASDHEKTEGLVNEISSILYKLYKNEDYYSVISQEAMLDTLNNITGILMIVLGGIAAISLIVGGIGIMNIMIVSVTERTKEIGIRKAIGAKKINILVQFLIESLLITGIGGIIGIGFGCAIISLISNLNFVPAVYSVEWIFISFFVSLIIGVIFGIFPAYKAAKLDPIIALRSE